MRSCKLFGANLLVVYENECISHKAEVGIMHHSYLGNLLAQPFLTLLARLTGE